MDPRYQRQRHEGLFCAFLGLILVMIVAGCLGSIYVDCMAAITKALP
jgi:hypothetical protein